MKFGFFETYGLVIVILAVVIFIAASMAKKDAKGIVIPRTTGPNLPGNDDGALIEKNTCPVCAEHDFYVGQQRGIYHTIYCGNPKCRATFLLVNYGPGQVWAHREPESGPQHLYD
jgi:hypothetical protein